MGNHLHYNLFMCRRNWIELTVLFMCLLSLSLSSFVFGGVTALPPLIGLVVLGIWWLLFGRPPPVRQTAFSYMLSLFVLLSASYAVVVHEEIEIKGVIALVAGLSVFLIASSIKNKERWLDALSMVVIVHLVAFYYQFAVYVIMDDFVDYLALIYPVMQSRALYGGDSFVINRFSGLFVEPAIYAHFMFMSMSAIMFNKSFESYRWLFYLTLGSIFLSMSVLGIFFGVLLLMVFICKNYRFYTGLRHMFFLILCLFFGILLLIQFNDNLGVYLASRLTNVFSDSSAVIRLGAWEHTFNRSTVELIFGNGAGNYKGFAITNSYHDIIYLFGVIGMLVAAILYFVLINKYAPRYSLIIIAASLLQGYVLTTLFWWLFVAFVTKPVISKQ